MDRKEIAKKIREAIFNRIEEDRAIHASSIEQEVEKVLASAYVDATSRPLYSIAPARGASAPFIAWRAPDYEPPLEYRWPDVIYEGRLAQVEIITHPEAADK